MPLFQFIGATIGASVMISVASLVWPKVTTSPRPEALSRVHDLVIQHPIGQQAERVLGVETVDVSQAISKAASSAVPKMRKLHFGQKFVHLPSNKLQYD